MMSPLYGPVPFVHLPDKTQHVVFMPDALPLDRPGDFINTEIRHRRTAFDALPTSSVIVTFSEHARNRLIHYDQLMPDSVKVWYPGGDRLRGVVAASLPERIHRPYILYPAANWRHKRHDFVFRVMDSVWRTHSDLNLVLTGMRITPDLVTNAEGIQDLNYVNDGVLRTLYENAEALVFPSAYEGFGMPVIEAMSLGCPVICAENTALTEIASGAALMIPDGSNADAVAAWRDAICETLPRERERLIAVGYERAEQYTWAMSHKSLHGLFDDWGIPSPRPEAEPIQIAVSPPILLTTENDTAYRPLTDPALYPALSSLRYWQRQRRENRGLMAWLGVVRAVLWLCWRIARRAFKSPR
ncbi:MAG: glycosyltransferase family 1 protein, partial [Chloroflexota bacterium]